jgi:hypothetical protein
VAEALSVRGGALDPAALAAYASLLKSKCDPCGGLQSVAELLSGAEFFELVDSRGAVVGRYALRVEHWSGGIEGQVLGAVGDLPGADLTGTVMPVIEKHFEGANCVTVLTKRKALVGRLLSMGYGIDGYTMRKAFR